MAVRKTGDCAAGVKGEEGGASPGCRMGSEVCGGGIVERVGGREWGGQGKVGLGLGFVVGSTTTAV